MTFECETNEPFIKVKWLKNNTDIFSGDKYRMHSDRKVHFLSVLVIGMDDDAEYTCAVVEDDQIRTSGRLHVEGLHNDYVFVLLFIDSLISLLTFTKNVLTWNILYVEKKTNFNLNMVYCVGAPLEIVKNLESVEVPESYAGEFECEISREDAEGTWYFENKEITPSLKYVMSSRRGRHSLCVKDVKKEDQGKYSFKVGDLQTSANLKMKCKFIYIVYLIILSVHTHHA